MKTITNEEARTVNGGRWKCRVCGKKFWLIGAIAHYGWCPSIEGLSFTKSFKFVL